MLRVCGCVLFILCFDRTNPADHVRVCPRVCVCIYVRAQELVRLQSMLEDERDLLSFALANIFFAYDRMQEGRVLLR